MGVDRSRTARFDAMAAADGAGDTEHSVVSVRPRARVAARIEREATERTGRSTALAELTGAKLRIVSVGPRREQTFEV